MASNLAARIQEDHLTCKICYGYYQSPKALACLHTFCENCLRDYVVSRSFDKDGKFPCPICRLEIIIPEDGVSGFLDNHNVASLFDTINVEEHSSPNPPDKLNTLTVPGELDNVPRGRSYSANDLQFLKVPDSNSSHYSSSTNDLSDHTQVQAGAPLYPTLPQSTCDITSTENDVEEFEPIANLILSFGKYGSNVSDFIKPKGLAVAHSGEIVISDMAGNRILIFNENGQLLKRFVCDCKVHDVGITSNRTILVVVHGAKSIILKEYTFDGKLLGSYGSFFRFDNPSGLSISPDNSIVVTSIENNQIYVFNADKKLQRRFGKKGGGDDSFMSPYHVATNKKGDIIVSDFGNSMIKVFNKLGKFKLKFGGEGTETGKFKKPLGVATDGNNNIYVADSGNYRVQVFTSKGKFLLVVLNETDKIGTEVRPCNIAVTVKNQVVVLLMGEGFAQVRVYTGASLPDSSEDSESCVIA